MLTRTFGLLLLIALGVTAEGAPPVARVATEKIQAKLTVNGKELVSDRNGNAVLVTHKNALIGANLQQWHYVEASAEKTNTLVMVHGLPESWLAWRNQIPALSKSLRIIAVDLKGYGLSDKRDGDYSVTNVSEELADFLTGIGVNQFYLVGHDWGANVTSSLASRHQDRVLKYIHMSSPLLVYDPVNTPHHKKFHDHPEMAQMLFSFTRAFLQQTFNGFMIDPRAALTASEFSRHEVEFGRNGVSQAVSRYFRDLSYLPDGTLDNSEAPDWYHFAVPLLIIWPDSDPHQPLSYLDGVENIPGLKEGGVVIITNSGHFSAEEQPTQVLNAMKAFLTP